MVDCWFVVGWANSKADRIKAIQDRSAVELERPYPNEHAARLKDPDQYDSLRRVNDEGGPGIDFIYGIKEGESEIQAIRFRSSQYSPAEARAWLAEHGFDPIEFEEATGDGEADREIEQKTDRILEGKYQRALLTHCYLLQLYDSYIYQLIRNCNLGALVLGSH